MATPTHDDTAPERAELERLATEISRHGLHGELCTPGGYSWAQKIADTDHPAETAAALARVLAATDLTTSE